MRKLLRRVALILLVFQSIGIGYGESVFGGNSNRDLVFTTPWQENPDLVIFPSSHDFGNFPVGFPFNLQHFTVENTGEHEITGYIQLAFSEHFYISCGHGAFSLAAGESKAVVVEFIPQQKGFWTTQLLVFSGDDQLNTMHISGTGITPSLITLSPSNIVFPPIMAGTISEPMPVNISWSGSFESIETYTGWGDEFKISLDPDGPYSSWLTLYAEEKNSSGAGQIKQQHAGKVARGPRPPIDLDRLPVEAYYPGKIYVKLTEETAKMLPAISIKNAATGVESLDLFLSTINGSGYAFFEGTSMACPNVSGASALILSFAGINNQVVSNMHLRELLLENTDNHYSQNPSFQGLLGTGRLNAFKALEAIVNQQETTIWVRFEPEQPGNYNGTVNVFFANLIFSTYLTGTALAGPELSLEPDIFDFGNVLEGDCSYAYFSLFNTGDTEGAGSIELESTDSFYLLQEEIEFILEPGLDVDVEVIFCPAGPGSASGNLLLYDEENNLISQSSLMGTGIPNTVVPAEFTLELMVFLEGAYDPGGENPMRTTLFTAGHLPLQQPYGPSLPYFDNPEPAWYYTGGESLEALPAGMVDWVLVELRDAPSAELADVSTVAARRAALLHHDGQVTDTDGVTLVFDLVPEYELFVVLYHRNHLAVMSAQPLHYNNGTYSWDFTNGMQQAYLQGQIHLGNGIYGMYGGEGDGNGQIQTQDKNEVWNLQAGQSGYHAGDFDLNGQVQTQDKNEIWIPNSGVASQVP